MSIYLSRIIEIAQNNEHTKEYINLVEMAIKRSNNKFDAELLTGCFIEKHHILPKSPVFGGPNIDENYVYFTLDEHYRAHVLLSKMFSGTKHYAAIAGLWAMAQINEKRPNDKNVLPKTTSEEYANLRNEYLKINILSWEERYGEEIANELKKNLSNYTSTRLQSLTVEERNELNEKISIGVKTNWENKSEEEKNEKSEYMRKIWFSKTEEEKYLITKNNKDWLYNMSNEQRETIIKKRQQTMNNKTQEEKRARSNKISYSHQNRTEEEKAETKKKKSLLVSNRTEEEKAEIAKKISDIYNSKSKEEKDEINKKRSDALKNRTMPEEERRKHNSTVVYKFFHPEFGLYECTSFDLRLKFKNLTKDSMAKLVRQVRKSCFGWTIIN
jgi:hypothetical protein